MNRFKSYKKINIYNFEPVLSLRNFGMKGENIIQQQYISYILCISNIFNNKINDIFLEYT